MRQADVKYDAEELEKLGWLNPAQVEMLRGLYREACQMEEESRRQIQVQQKRIEGAVAEIERLKPALTRRNQEIKALRTRYSKAKERIEALKTTLQDLYDLQNGSPLPKYEKEWTKVMKDAETLLKEHNDA